MLRSLWGLVVEIARGVDAGHAIWHGVPVQDAARHAGAGISREGDEQQVAAAGSPPA